MQTNDSLVAASESVFRQLKRNDEAKELAAWRAEATTSDYLLDIPRGIASGTEGFVKSIGSLGNDIVKAMGGEGADDEVFETRIKTRTGVGDLVSGVTQFTLGFLPASGVLRGAGLLQGAGKLTTAARGLTAGAAADFTAFDGANQRLSNLIEEFPTLSNPVTRYLASSPDDSHAEGRLKNAVEGLGLGIVAEGFLSALRGFKRVKAAEATGNSEAVAKAVAETEEEVAKSSLAHRHIEDILTAAPNIDREQATKVLQLYAGVARHTGESLDDFLTRTLKRFVKGEEFDQEFARAQGLTPAVRPRPEPVEPIRLAELGPATLDTGSVVSPNARSAPTQRPAEIVTGDGFPEVAKPVGQEPGGPPSVVLGERDLTRSAVTPPPVEPFKPADLPPPVLGSADVVPGVQRTAEPRSRPRSQPQAVQSSDAFPEVAKAFEPVSDGAKDQIGTLFNTGEDGGVKGLVRFFSDSSAMIGLFKTADFSTLVHESFHVWRRWMPEAELAELSKALGVVDGKWTVEAEERAARLFERYLHNGTTDSPEAQPLFDKFKNWMTGVYKTVTDGPISEDVSPEVQQVFNKVLGLSGDGVPARPALISEGSNLLFQRNTPAPALVKNFGDFFAKAVEGGANAADAVADGLRTHFNWSRTGLDTDVMQVAKHLMGAIDDTVFEKAVGGVRTNSSLLADAAAQVSGTDGAELLKAVVSVADKTKRLDLAKNLILAKGIRDVMTENISRAAGPALAEFRSGGLGTGTKQRLQAMIAAFQKSEVAAATISAEAARTTQAGNVVAKRAMKTLDPKVIDAIGRSLESGDASGTRLLMALQMAGDDPGVLQNVIRWYEGAGKSWFRKALDVHNEFWLNSILSGYHTHAANMLSQTIQTAVLPAERFVGGMVRFAFGRPGGSEAMQSAGRIYAGLLDSIADVFRLAHTGRLLQEDNALGQGYKAFLKSSPIIDSVTKTSEGPLNAINAATFGLDNTNPLARLINGFGQVVRFPTRLLTTEDEIFRQLNVRAYLKDEGMRKGLEAGITDPHKLAQYTADYVRTAFDSNGAVVNQGARHWGQMATFTQDWRPGSLGERVSRLVADQDPKGDIVHPFLRLVLPFIRVPTNIFNRAVQYTPGLNFLVNQEFREMVTNPDPLIRSQAIGRATIGGAFWALAVSLGLSGKITGGGPGNQGERNALLATGWRPYSFQFTKPDGSKEYVDFRRLEPFGMLLGIAADYAEAGAHLHGDDTKSLAAVMAASLAKNVANRSYLTSLAEFANAMTQPDRFMQSWLEQRAGSYVPNVLAQSNTDPHMREIRSVMDAVRSRIPGLSQDLAPKRNLYGEPIPVTPGWLPFGAGTPLARTLSPLAYSKRAGDPVKEEVAKLQAGFSLPSSRYQGMDLKTFVNDRGQDAYDRLQELRGQVKIGGRDLPAALDRLFASQRYQALPQPDKENDTLNPRVREVQRVLSDYHDAAVGQLLREYPDILKLVRERRQKAMQPSTTPVLELLRR